MKYQVRIHEDLHTVELNPGEGPGTFRARMGDEEMEVSYRKLGENRLRISTDHREIEVFLIGEKGSKEIFISGYSFFVSEMGTPKRRAPSPTAGDITQNQVTPPMPSVVVRILVQVGDWVTVGQGLIVVSAMKMETTLKAPKEGRVVKINTTLQAKVMPGDLLIEIEEGKPDGGRSTV